MLPFTREQFFNVFVDYNDAVWPLQLVAYLLGFFLVALVVRGAAMGGRAIGAGLAAMWAWTGLVYHGAYFSEINKAALAFEVLFVIQAGLLLYLGVVRDRLALTTPTAPSIRLGWFLVIFAAVVYPMIGIWTGHAYPEMPMFGITPCPLTIFTLGLLLLTGARASQRLLVIPIAWSLIGGSAAFLLGVPQDWGLLLSGIAVVMVVIHDRSHPGKTEQWAH